MQTTKTAHSYFLLTSLLAILLYSCQTIKQSPKYGFTEGYYYSRLYHKKQKHIYIVPSEDSIKIYSAKKLGQGLDTTEALKIALPPDHKPSSFKDYSFKKTSLDFDVLNVLFKLRPSVGNFPPQFNNNILNGAFYLGKRNDIYKIKYKQTPLQTYHRSTTHYGYSFGFFTGIGASRIDEYVTQNALSIQYDGLVNVSGVSGLVALDKINFGINLGFDHLLDKNKHAWIYEGKPWFAISIGLNLN